MKFIIFSAVTVLCMPLSIISQIALTAEASQVQLIQKRTLDSQNFLMALNFPLRGSKFTELGDHRRMETSITISNNRRIDATTRIWTAKKFKGFTGSVAVVITDRPGNVLYVTNPQTWGVDCKACPGPSDRTQGWSDTIPANIFNNVGGYAVIHTTSPRDRWRSWLSNAKEAAGEIKAIYAKF